MEVSLLEPVIRALLHYPNPGFGHKHRLLEHLRQHLHANEDHFESLIKRHEHCIEFILEITVQSSLDLEFILQFDRCDEGSCASTECLIKSNETKQITLRHGQKSVVKVITLDYAAQKDILHNKFKAQSFFKKWFERNVLMTIKTKHMIPENTEKFTINDDTTVTCLLKIQKTYADRFDLPDLNCLISMLSESFMTEVCCKTTMEILKVVCNFHDIDWVACELLLIGRFLDLKFESCALNMVHSTHTNLAQNREKITANVNEALKVLIDGLTMRAAEFLESLPGCSMFSFHSTVAPKQEVIDFFHPILAIASLMNEKFYLFDLLKTYLKKAVADSVEESKLELPWSFNEGPLSMSDISKAIDTLHVSLRRNCVIYRTLFKTFRMNYCEIVVNLLDQEISEIVKLSLKEALNNLHSHDDEEIRAFTKHSMQIFDSLRLLNNLFKSEQINSCLSEYELWFKQSVVFWSHAWRSIYLNFVKQSVEDSSNCDTVALSETAWQMQEKQRYDVDIHDSAVLCLAFCKSLCDDIVRLDLHDVEMMLLCYLQVITILSDCLVLFSSRIHQQSLKAKIPYSEVTKAANGIEHASDHLINNFERFLQIKQILPRLQCDDKDLIITAVRKLFETTKVRCKSFSTDLIKRMCHSKYADLRKQCREMMAQNKKFKITTITSDESENLLNHVEKLCSCIKQRLLPRLYYVAVDIMWQDIMGVFETSLVYGQNQGYYETIYRSCEAIAMTLGVDWQKELRPSLKATLFMNRATTLELILQYYSSLGDYTINSTNNEGAPKVMLKIGYVHTTNRHVLLQIDVLSAYDVPILDVITKSSDPYIRLELYPHCLFSPNNYPAVSTSTIKRTLSPVWNESFQLSIPEHLYFLYGASLCITLLDHDVLSYNDLGGQAIYPLAAIPEMHNLDNAKTQEVALKLPFAGQYNTSFQILKERYKRDRLAQEVVDYECYLRSYRILPPTASDSNDSVWADLIKMTGKKQKLKHLFKKLHG